MTTPAAVLAYDLLADPWIPCLDRRGLMRKVNIMQALEDAHELREITDASPLVTMGVYRLLIAILHGAMSLDDDRNWEELWHRGAFPAGVINRIRDICKGRFNLFDASHPFYQSGDIPLNPMPKETKSVGSLSLEDPTGTGVLHYCHTPEDRHACCPACSAKALVALPAFATSGGQGIKPSVNGVPPIYVLPLGETLFQTLLLNYVLPPFRPARADSGLAWCGTGIVGHKEEHGTAGLLESLTWQARRVRLFPEAAQGRCTRCGASSAVWVTSIIYAQGCSLIEGTPPTRDPWAAYSLRQDEKTGITEQIPVRPREGRDTWRDLDALFLAEHAAVGALHRGRRETIRPRILDQLDVLADAEALPRDMAVQFLTVGLRTDMKAKVFEWRADRFDFPVAVLRQAAAIPVANALQYSEDVARVLGDALCRLHPDAEREKPRWGDIRALLGQVITLAQREYWTRLDMPFRQALLDPRTHDGDQQEAWFTEWIVLVGRVAGDVLSHILDNYDTDAAALARQQAARGVFYSLLRKLTT